MKVKILFFEENFIDAIGAGVYQINIIKDQEKKSLYIGESVFVLLRCSAHLYELKKDPNYFGFTEGTINNDKFTLEFKLLEKNNDRILRKSKEQKLIKENIPLSQSGISDRQKAVEEKIKALTEFLKNE